MRPSRGTGGPSIRGHHPLSPSLGVRPYSSNPSRREILRSCQHPPYGGGYLHGHLVSFRTIKNIAGCDATMQALDRGRTSVLCHYSDQLGHSKRSVHSESNTTSSSGSSLFGIISNNNMVNIRKSRANGGKTTVESRNTIFIETPPNLLPATRRLSPQQDLESCRMISATTRSTATTFRATTCCETCRSTLPLWSLASTRLPERYNYFCLNKPPPA